MTTMTELIEASKNGIHMPIEYKGKLADSSQLIRNVDDIRRSSKEEFLKNREISQLVIGELKEKGKFLKTSSDEVFYFSKKAMRMDTPQFRSMLNSKFGLNYTEKETRYTLGELETEGPK